MTETSPALINPQDTGTSETATTVQAVLPANYESELRAGGLQRVKALGHLHNPRLTAQVNVEIALARCGKPWTGERRVADSTPVAARQQNFKMEQLQSIPNGRDMWALLAVTPSVQMGRIDVGGNRAGTQTGYTAYGMSGQVRVLIEGINTTEGTGGAGFYFDYASLEEAFLGTSGQSAENADHGVQSQSSRAVGSNTFQGVSITSTWYNNSGRDRTSGGTNSAPTALTADTHETPNSFVGSNEITEVLRSRHQRRRARCQGQAVDVDLPRAVQRGGAAAVQFTAAPATPSCEPVVEYHPRIADQQEQARSVTSLGSDGNNRMPTARHYNTTSPRNNLRAGQGAAGSTRAPIKETVSDKYTSKRATADFGYYFPLGDTFPITSPGATRPYGG